MIHVALHIQNDIIREGLMRILTGLSEVAVRSDQEPPAGKSVPGVIITDTKPAHKRSKRSPGLILWQYGNEYNSEIFEKNVLGILDGGCTSEDVVLAVRHAAKGKKFISSSFAEILATGRISANDSAPVKLSPREDEVLKKISAGNSLTAIAEEMNLNINTVSTYQARIIKKLNLKSSADLIRFVSKQQL